MSELSAVCGELGTTRLSPDKRRYRKSEVLGLDFSGYPTYQAQLGQFDNALIYRPFDC
jgi:hypothetical protein